MKIFVKGSAYVDVVEDSYENGEQPGTGFKFDVNFNGTYSTIERLLAEVHSTLPYFSPDPTMWLGLPESYGDMATIQSDALVSVDEYSEDIEEPTPDEIQAWKRGEIKLYNTHISIPIMVGEIRNATYEDFAEMGIEGY